MRKNKKQGNNMERGRGIYRRRKDWQGGCEMIKEIGRKKKRRGDERGVN